MKSASWPTGASPITEEPNGRAPHRLLGRNHRLRTLRFRGQRNRLGRILQGDRFYTLLKIRQLTYGSTYAFTTSCQHTACRERIDWEVDLDDLPVRPLAEESRLAFQDGNRFETMLPAEDRRVWFRLLSDRR